jgi:RNase P subunit RPR2
MSVAKEGVEHNKISMALRVDVIDVIELPGTMSRQTCTACTSSRFNIKVKTFITRKTKALPFDCFFILQKQ